MKEWSRKPRILMVGDSSAIHTGFARVIKNICLHLYNKGCYELKTIGWFHMQTDEMVPYEIIPTFRDPANILEVERDKYSANTFPRVVEEYKPDLVICVGDTWMVETAATCKLRNRYKLILYVPIDGHPIPPKWTEVFKSADIVVAYGEFGKRGMLMRDSSLKNIRVINHGVDTDIFRPYSTEDRKTIRHQMNGDGLFVIGCVARNQPRKNLPALFKAANLFVREYSVCRQCKSMFLDVATVCPNCKSEDMLHGDRKTNTRFYLHMALRDCGWDIPELIDRFALKGTIVFPKGLEIGKGVDIARLAEINNSFDVFALPTTGEGWGLPIIEAMACGVPVVVTDYSAHVEFCRGCTELIKVGDFYTEPMTNIERAHVDVYDFAMRLDRLYYDDPAVFAMKWGKYMEENYGTDASKLITGKKYRDFLAKAGRERALQYAWPRINAEWESLVNEVLQFKGVKASPLKMVAEYQAEEI